MTLLTICQNAADETKGPRPASVHGNAAPEAQELLRLANKVGTHLMRSTVWQVLREEKTFTALAQETQTSIIPADFDRFIPETFWDRTNGVLVTGPIGPVEWQGLKAASYAGRPKFAHRGGNILAVPAFDGGETLAFEYVSKNWVDTNGDGSGNASAWAADANTSILDEELMTLGVVYEFLAANGLPVNMAAFAYETRFALMIENDQPSESILVAGDIFGGGRHFGGAPTGNVPDAV